ncbi:MAG: hypothetical protein ABSA12_15765 [Verrucomicrobiia bacterium]|jgi:hypothetical protein
MRRLIALVFLAALLAAPSGVRAQISVQVKMDRDTLIVFESIPAVVTIRNFSGRTIELANQGETHWLNFLITDEAGATLSPVGDTFATEPVRIEPGRTQSISVNLLPHFDLRQRGVFTARAAVEADGIHVVSAPVNFTIINGREIWRQTVGLPVAEGETNQQYRTYSLLLRRSSYDEVLYAGVQDEPHDLVYGMIPLGNFIALGNPTAKVDGSGHLHVLYRSGPRSISYDEIDPDANIVKRLIYSDVMSTPQLVAQDDGVVTVQGGEQVYPRLERVMTDQDLQPAPPVITKPQKRKHWWWPFGPKNTPPASTNSVATATTNAPATNVEPHS